MDGDKCMLQVHIVLLLMPTTVPTPNTSITSYKLPWLLLSSNVNIGLSYPQHYSKQQQNLP